MLLEVRNLDAGFGSRQVLFDVSFSVQSGEILALIGPNGAGKSTVLKVLFGLLDAWQGEVVFRKEAIQGASPASLLRRGIALAPQGEKVFGGMSVRENVEIGALAFERADRARRVQSVLSGFSPLEGRLNSDAGRLSGGEQQMVALARCLVAEPKLLLLDEPSGGLSPEAVADLFGVIADVCSMRGLAAIIVEHRIPAVLQIASAVCGLKLGRVLFLEEAEKVREDDGGMLADLFL